MPLNLPPLIRQLPIVDAKGYPTQQFAIFWDTFARSISAGVDAVAAAQAAATAANDAAVTAQAAADTATATAEAAQAAVASIPTGAASITANYDVTTGDANVLVDATAGPVTVRLLPLIANPPPVTIRKTDASANAVTVAARVGDTINGGPNISLATQYESASCVNDGTEWFA